MADNTLAPWSDAQLEAELDRRRNYDLIPKQVEALTTHYLACGGTRERLVKAVTDAPAPAAAQSGGGSSSGTTTSGSSTGGTTANVGVNLGTTKT